MSKATQLTYYYNGTIRTMNSANPVSPHMLVGGDRIWHCDASPAPLGLDFRDADFARVRESMKADVKFVDLRGHTVIPGICDAHIHFIWWGAFLSQVDLSQATSEENCIELMREQAPNPAPDEWIVGGRWAHNLWASRQLPGLVTIDALYPNNPVMLKSKCGHVAWVNSVALQMAGVTASTPDPEGGEIERRDGKLTGILKENGMDVVSRLIGDQTDSQRFESLRRAQEFAHAEGITSMQTPEDMETWGFLQKAHAAQKLSMRVNFWVPVSALDEFVATRTRHGLGDDRLRVSAVKIFADGSLGGRTGYMYDPYENEPDNYGIVVTSAEEMTAHTLKANRAGLSMAIHAIGDRSVGDVLTAYETAAGELGTDGDTTSNPVLRNRIEHVQVFAERDMERLRKLKPVASMQPIHLCADMGPADRHWGDRSRYAYAMRTLADMGCTLAFGSDAPVEPTNPFYGIYAAISRNNLRGEPGDGWYPEEKISLQESLEGYTINGAIASGQQNKLGSLDIGKLADFVILPQDPFDLNPEQIRDMKPVATISGGECVFADGQWKDQLA